MPVSAVDDDVDRDDDDDEVDEKLNIDCRVDGGTRRRGLEPLTVDDDGVRVAGQPCSVPRSLMVILRILRIQLLVKTIFPTL